MCNPLKIKTIIIIGIIIIVIIIIIIDFFFSMLSKNSKCHDLKIAYGVKG